MKENRIMAKQVRRNWLLDMGLFAAGLGASLTGIYFLLFPVGGYQGGRNPYYGITILFERETWDVLHAWTGVAMIAAIVIHLVLHWSWLVGTVKRIFSEIAHGSRQMSFRSRINAGVDAMVATGFLLSAASGIYFLLAPAGISGHNLQTVIFSSQVWDVIHTWSSVAMLVGIMVHLVLHWTWIKSVSARCLAPNKEVKIQNAPVGTSA
jgi:hypothetical protein